MERRVLGQLERRRELAVRWPPDPALDIGERVTERLLGLVARPSLIGAAKRHVLPVAVRPEPQGEHRRLAARVDHDAACRSTSHADPPLAASTRSAIASCRPSVSSRSCEPPLRRHSALSCDRRSSSGSSGRPAGVVLLAMWPSLWLKHRRECPHSLYDECRTRVRAATLDLCPTVTRDSVRNALRANPSSAMGSGVSSTAGPLLEHVKCNACGRSRWEILQSKRAVGGPSKTVWHCGLLALLELAAQCVNYGRPNALEPRYRYNTSPRPGVPGCGASRRQIAHANWCVFARFVHREPDLQQQRDATRCSQGLSLRSSKPVGPRLRRPFRSRGYSLRAAFLVGGHGRVDFARVVAADPVGQLNGGREGETRMTPKSVTVPSVLPRANSFVRSCSNVSPSRTFRAK